MNANAALVTFDARPGAGNAVLHIDARIDNAAQLRRDLIARGVPFVSNDDGELILRAWESWGDDCVDRILGDWVFAIWDAQRGEVFAARDAIGVRQIYYSQDNGAFICASEIRALLGTGRITPRLNESRLLDFFTEEFDRDDTVGTMYQGISRLPAGHAMRASASSVRTWRYWNPAQLEPLAFGSMRDCADALMHELQRAIDDRLQSCARPAAMLSGGMDSSTIVALLGRDHLARTGGHVKTYSLVLEDGIRCEDWNSVGAMVAANAWLRPTFISSDIGKQLAHRLDADIAHADEPFSIVGGLPYRLAYEAAAADRHDAVFDGMAGDLLFYSPGKSLGEVIARREFGALGATLAAHRNHRALIGGLRSLAMAGARPLVPQPARRAIREWRAARYARSGDLGLLRPDLAAQQQARHARLNEERNQIQRLDEQAQCGARDTVMRDQSTHAQWFTGGILSFAHERNNPLAARAGVKVLSPFSDRRVIEFAIRMPIAAKLAMPSYKHLLRTATDGLLPEAVRARRSIGSHPGWDFNDRIARHYPAMTQPRIAAEIAQRLAPWIDPKAVQKLWSSGAGRDDRWRALNLVIAARWLQLRGLA